MQKEFRKGSYVISTDKRKLNFGVVHGFLAGSYWAKGRSPEVTGSSVKNSVCFGLYHDRRQIGFARVISDKATFAYLADVFIIDEYRGRGLSKWLMKVIFEHPMFRTVKSWMLATRDAHGLYRKFGFKRLSDPGKYMQRKS
ncbi:MAG: GNAT family N-acetyltransferase [Ignavibacteria bacterium]|nr:GNAT family N-acetyltransferase [Ignavibacteria bacterium]